MIHQLIDIQLFLTKNIRFFKIFLYFLTCLFCISFVIFLFLLSIFLFFSHSSTLGPSSSGLSRSHLSHLQWKHPNLQMLSINHLRSNYNPINLCFHAPCCRTASTLPTSSPCSERDRQRAGEWRKVALRGSFNGRRTIWGKKGTKTKGRALHAGLWAHILLGRSFFIALPTINRECNPARFYPTLEASVF